MYTKTVRPVLSDRRPVCPVPLPKVGHSPQFSAHVYCGQTTGWITMPLGKEVGLGPRHIVVDGDPAPPTPKRGTAPISTHICCGRTAGWIKTPLFIEISLGPGHIVLDEDPAHPLPKKGPQSPNFRSLSVVATRQTAG